MDGNCVLIYHKEWRKAIIKLVNNPEHKPFKIIWRNIKDKYDITNIQKNFFIKKQKNSTIWWRVNKKLKHYDIIF